MPKSTPRAATRPRRVETQPHWVTQEEVAEHLGVSKLTVRRYIADGTIPAHRLGPRLIRIDLNELDAAMRPIRSA